MHFSVVDTPRDPIVGSAQMFGRPNSLHSVLVGLSMSPPQSLSRRAGISFTFSRCANTHQGVISHRCVLGVCAGGGNAYRDIVGGIRARLLEAKFLDFVKTGCCDSIIGPVGGLR